MLEEFEQLIFAVSPHRHSTSSVLSVEKGINKGTGTNQDVPMPETESHHQEVQKDEESNIKGDIDGDIQEVACPFLNSDVDCIVTKAFNFSILLIELDQTGRFNTTSIVASLFYTQNNHNYFIVIISNHFHKLSSHHCHTYMRDVCVLLFIDQQSWQRDL